MLDPGDGRDLGLRLPARVPADFSHLNPPPPPADIHAALDAAYLEAVGRVATQAERAVADGLGVVKEGLRFEPGEWVDGRFVVKVVGTYRLVRLEG